MEQNPQPFKQLPFNKFKTEYKKFYVNIFQLTQFHCFK